ncbi:CBR-EHBP-1 protein [Ditylenchus destructor]|nr:CBR-EHBP-1 protein [Ditylenchus destructor]
MTSFEKDLRNLENIATEIEKITQRISELEGLSAYVEQKMRDLVPGSEEEEKLVAEHLKLVAEKNSLVRRQDYLNEPEKDEDEKKNIDELMDTLKTLVDKKNDLTHMLMDNEAEEEEEEELSRRAMQQTNFLRGETVSTSKRLLTWLKS